MTNPNPSPRRDLDAFDTVVSTYEGPLLRYVSRIVLDWDAAQDVVQNTFLRLFKRWKEELSPSPQLSSWLYRVAHNCAVDYLRRETRKTNLHQEHARETPAYMPPDRGEGFRIGEAAESAAEALASLPLRERQLVVLKIYEEKSYKEISEITGLTVSNVGYILHYAMKKMAAILKKNRGAKP